MKDSRSCRKWLAEHIDALPRSGIRDFFELVNSMEGVISLGIGEPDFVTPWPIREATIYALEKGFTTYTSNLGMYALRREVCKYVHEKFGVQYNPEHECIITVGVSEALDLILRATLTPGDEVVYHEPCYVSYAPGIRMTHAVPVSAVTNEEEDFRLDPACLEEKISCRTKLLLLNFPNNPTGAGLSRDDKRQLARIAVEHDLLVISDEIYEEISYGERSPSIASFPGMRERTVVLNGFSKAHAMTGYRIAYACGPAELVAAMMKIHQYSMLCASSIGQAAALEALRNGDPEKEEMRIEYHQRRNIIVKRLREMGLPCVMPRGAFYVFPRIRDTGLTSGEFARRLLAEKHVAVVPGPAFGECGEGYVRCSYAASMDEIETAMHRIAEFVAGLPGD